MSETVPAVVLVVLAAQGPSPAPIDGPSLLRQSDLAAFTPESFRARMRVTEPDDRDRALELEVWRSGEGRALVRFLGPREKGKYLLRLGADLWFLAPGARRPVRLKPSHRLHGSASLDDILGLRYARDYTVESLEELEEPGGREVALSLAARAPGTPYPRVRYVVDRASRRPLHAEYFLASGRRARTVEFLEWSAPGRPRLRRLRLRDDLRGGAVTEVEVPELDERPVPDGLFSLTDGAARSAVFGGAGRTR
jgi:hypothetical protein